MSGYAVDVIVFAPLAPILAVLLFWFIQLIFIESQKYFLSKIRKKHEPFCRFTNFIGVLFQTLCHALGYTVTISGIAHFQVNIHYGKVKPKKEKKGIFEWISNSFLFIGPFFIPPFLLFICLIFLINREFVVPLSIKYTFAEALINFGSSLFSFSEMFFNFLFSIDLLHPAHLGFLILLIFLGLGIRPSYIGEQQRRKVDMIYDLKNIKDHILRKPLYIIILFLFSYVFFYASFLLKNNWYIIIFSFFGWLSLIAIVSIIITHGIIILIKTSDEIPGKWRILPYFMLPFSYITMRVIFYYFPIDNLKNISLIVMILSTICVLLILLKYKTNKFKSKPKMKQMKVEDGPKRIIKQ